MNSDNSPIIKLEFDSESQEITEKEILQKMTGNAEKCKQLFSKAPVFWHNIPIYFIGYEIENKVIYITKCKNAVFFSPHALRASYFAKEGFSPNAAVAFSPICDGILLRLVFFGEIWKNDLQYKEAYIEKYLDLFRII